MIKPLIIEVLQIAGLQGAIFTVVVPWYFLGKWFMGWLKLQRVLWKIQRGYAWKKVDPPS